MLLIVTSVEDFTADFLITELIKRRLPYFRLNAEEISSLTLNFMLAGSSQVTQITAGPKRAQLSDIRAIWYRRAIQPSPSRSLSPADQTFVAGELRHAIGGLILNPGILWVNPIDKVHVAEHKLYQLRLADDLGFRVPRTIVSNDIDKLREFTAICKDGVICKPIFHGLFTNGRARYAIYTRRIALDAITEDAVRVCPVFLQEEIKRDSDVRVTFIGQQYFVAEIRGGESLIDWRDPTVRVEYTVGHLPAELVKRCREMLKRLGLAYGAFDFIKTPDGEFVFLEVNPTGEWAWLESRLQFPMRQAFIDLFFGSGA